MRRKKAEGWRSFSIADIVKFRIISDLREFGFDTEKIKAILEKISRGTIEVIDPGTAEPVAHDFLQLEHYLFSSLSGNKILLLVYPDGRAFFSSEEDAILCHFTLEDSKPLLMLPFFTYVNKVPLQDDLRFPLSDPR